MDDVMYSVPLSKLIESMNLENLTPNIDTKEILLKHVDVNRPALQLAGFFDYFDADRIQVIGNVESAYVNKMSKTQGKKVLEKLMDYKIPCIIFCRNIEVEDSLVKLANKKGVPILRTAMATSDFMAEIIRFMRHELAPRITLHGVFVDIYGEGVLIIGESGIGKSEAALELIKRGHRLVSDDVVKIKKVSENTLIGTAPEITKHLIELRGIGIIDVRTLFGFASVKDFQKIDLIVKLMEWDKEYDFDRLGLEEQYTDILGVNVISHSIPIRPGRNLAIICESAAVNNRQKKMGYNAAKEFYDKVTSKINQDNDKGE